jgi:uncharacterized NAD-dependent epimerase/dehydratase family protein
MSSLTRNIRTVQQLLTQAMRLRRADDNVVAGCAVPAKPYDTVMATVDGLSASQPCHIIPVGLQASLTHPRHCATGAVRALSFHVLLFAVSVHEKSPSLCAPAILQ